MHGRYQYLEFDTTGSCLSRAGTDHGLCNPEAIVSMTRIETSTIGGTGMKEFTTTSGLSRIIAMAATIADSTAISKGHIGSGAITTTTITIRP